MPKRKPSKSKDYSNKIEKLVISFGEILNALGKYFETVGTIEDEHKDFKDFMEKAKKDPSFLADIVEKMPIEVSQKILNLFLRMALITNRTEKMSDLSSKEKIKYGKEMQKIASEFKNLIRYLKKRKK